MPFIRQTLWIPAFIVNVLLLLPSPVVALELEAYEAIYKTSFNGIPSGIKVHTSLKPIKPEGEAWEMLFSADSWVMDFAEISQFTWHGCHAQTQQYDFFFKGLGIHRTVSTRFNWKHNMATSQVRNKPDSHYGITPRTTDPLAFSMMARCTLEKGPVEQFDFHVADSNNTYYYRFKVVGREEIDTGLGKLDTIKVERIYNKSMPQTRFWIAPDLGYFMVKFEHAENLAVRGGLTLHRLTKSPDINHNDLAPH